MGSLGSIRDMLLYLGADSEIAAASVLIWCT